VDEAAAFGSQEEGNEKEKFFVASFGKFVGETTYFA
jgi:hypothetical protein